MPPGGSYNPAITLESILLSIQLLLASPNPDDPLRDDVSDEYRYNRELFNENARKFSGLSKANEVEEGNCSKKLKTEETPKRSIKETLTSIDVSEVINENEQKPNTSNECGTDAELVSVSVQSKSNRKRKHDET